MQRKTEARPAWVIEWEKRDEEREKQIERKQREKRGVQILERRCRRVRVGVLWLNQVAAACKRERVSKRERESGNKGGPPIQSKMLIITGRPLMLP